MHLFGSPTRQIFSLVTLAGFVFRSLHKCPEHVICPRDRVSARQRGTVQNLRKDVLYEVRGEDRFA